MDQNAPIKYSDLFKPDSSIIDLIAQLKELKKEYSALMDGIKSQTATLKQSLSSVSGASSQGQEAIKNASSLVEKYNRKEVELAQSTTETAKRIAQVSAEIRFNNNMTKLSNKLANARKDSYDALSAQYSINKLKLNAMTKEERANVNIGGALEKETARIYQEMKRLQELTGKHTLSVGDYGVAAANLASDIRNGIQGLTQMRIEMLKLEKEGQRGSERWTELSDNSQKLARDLKDLKKQYQIVKLETNALGQQTGLLNDAIGVLSTASGGLSTATGLFNLFGGEAAGAAEALVQVNSALSVANGVSQVFNSVFKQGNVLLAVRTAQLKIATVAQKLQTKSTVLAKAAQLALNVVASANPYFLLATAIAAVTAGLVAFVSSSARAVKQQRLMNQQTSAAIEYMEAYDTDLTRISRENKTAIEQELAIAKARKAGYAETQRLENRIQSIKERTNSISSSYYRREIEDLNKNRVELERLRKELLKAESVRGGKRVSIQLDAEEPAQKFKASKIVDILQGKIDNLSKKVEIATNLTYDKQQLDADARALIEQHKQEALEVQALEREALRQAEDIQIALLNQRFNKQRALEKANTARQIVDLQVRLQTENNLTLSARKAINGEIVNLQRQLGRTLFDINAEETRANIDAVRTLEDARFSARQDTAEKQKEVLKTEYDREVEDIQIRLRTERDLTTTEIDALTAQLTARWAQYQKDRYELENQIRLDDLSKQAIAIENQIALVSEGTTKEMNLRLQALEIQRQQELTENRMLASDKRQDEASINAKYDRLRLTTSVNAEINMNRAKLEVDQAYEESVFNLSERSVIQVSKLQLEQQRERIRLEIEAQKKILETQTGEQAALTQTTIKTLENQLKVVDNKIKTGGTGAQVSNIWELFGFGSDAANAMQTISDQVIGSLKEIANARVEAAQKAVEAAQTEIEAAKSVYDYELQARANGYANQVSQAKQELELAKKKEADALKEKEKAQKQAEAIDTITQISSLVTASANIWSSLAGIPGVGIALALAGIATMFGSFAIAKVKAKQAAQESYGEGTVELLSGGSHQSGNDVDLGTSPSGKKRRAEGGEFFAVINKRNSRRYRDIIPDVINSLNSGTFAQRYIGAYDKTNGIALSIGEHTDVSRLEDDVRTLRKQGEKHIYVDAQGNRVETYKNLTTKIVN